MDLKNIPSATPQPVLDALASNINSSIRNASGDTRKKICEVLGKNLSPNIIDPSLVGTALATEISTVAKNLADSTIRSRIGAVAADARTLFLGSMNRIIQGGTGATAFTEDITQSVQELEANFSAAESAYVAADAAKKKPGRLDWIGNIPKNPFHWAFATETASDGTQRMPLKSRVATTAALAGAGASVPLLASSVAGFSAAPVVGPTLKLIADYVATSNAVLGPAIQNALALPNAALPFASAALAVPAATLGGLYLVGALRNSFIRYFAGTDKAPKYAGGLLNKLFCNARDGLKLIAIESWLLPLEAAVSAVGATTAAVTKEVNDTFTTKRGLSTIGGATAGFFFGGPLGAAAGAAAGNIIHRFARPAKE